MSIIIVTWNPGDILFSTHAWTIDLDAGFAEVLTGQVTVSETGYFTVGVTVVTPTGGDIGNSIYLLMEESGATLNVTVDYDPDNPPQGGSSATQNYESAP